MTDLRQGVTEVQHKVLDLIERQAANWSAIEPDPQLRLAQALGAARQAVIAEKLTSQRFWAIEAAARLIDVADELDRLIDAKSA